MKHTYYLEITKPEDLKQIEADLRGMLTDGMLDPDVEKQQVTIQFTVDFDLIAGLIGWIYTFWVFGKTYFFPDGKFRKPKLLELYRNFQIVTGVLKLKNTLIGLWKDRKSTLQDIGDMLQKLIPKSQQHG